MQTSKSEWAMNVWDIKLKKFNKENIPIGFDKAHALILAKEELKHVNAESPGRYLVKIIRTEIILITV